MSDFPPSQAPLESTSEELLRENAGLRRQFDALKAELADKDRQAETIQAVLVKPFQLNDLQQVIHRVVAVGE